MSNTVSAPQNIKSLISTVGEGLALFNLYLLVHQNEDLEIFKNYSDSGYDIGIRNNKTGKKVKIEVKTRQNLLIDKTESRHNSCHFTLTENEYNCCDFMVGYWLDYNSFFIVPKDQLKETKSKTKKLYKFILSRLKAGKKGEEFSKHAMENFNGWNLLLTSV